MHGPHGHETVQAVVRQQSLSTLKLLNYSVSHQLVPVLAAGVASLTHLSALHLQLQPSEVSQVCVAPQRDALSSQKAKHAHEQRKGGCGVSGAAIEGPSTKKSKLSTKDRWAATSVRNFAKPSSQRQQAVPQKKGTSGRSSVQTERMPGAEELRRMRDDASLHVCRPLLHFRQLQHLQRLELSLDCIERAAGAELGLTSDAVDYLCGMLLHMLRLQQLTLCGSSCRMLSVEGCKKVLKALRDLKQLQCVSLCFLVDEQVVEGLVELLVAVPSIRDVELPQFCAVGMNGTQDYCDAWCACARELLQYVETQDATRCFRLAEACRRVLGEVDTQFYC